MAMDHLIEHWGEGLVAASVAPSLMADGDFMEWAGRLERLAASPSTIGRIFDLIGEFDVRDVLPSIRVPTLVLHRREDNFIKIDHSRYMAERIPGAKMVELEGGDNMYSIGDSEALLGEIEEFLTGERHDLRTRPDARDRPVHGHLRLHGARGPHGRPHLEVHARAPRRPLPARAERHRGREVKHTGDGFLATFDGPARAIRCAADMADAVASIGLQVRAGLHTGELEVMDGDLGGMAVHIARG